MTAYYNEIDPAAAQWLRNLIAAGHIAHGEVDERSIEDVLPADLTGFTQCHFFAGIGVWSYALRRAGWDDTQPVWTGSCPCQPFSAAGKGAGFDDERHLWPAFQHLIRECKPSVVIGEQVASKDAEPWIDLVHTDMEALGYAFGAIPFPSASVGAPHIRDRLYWCGTLANANNAGLERRVGVPERAVEFIARPGDLACGLADTSGGGCDWRASSTEFKTRASARTSGCDNASGLADAESDRHERARQLSELPGGDGTAHGSSIDRPNAINGFWSDADWLGCRDGKWRPVEPGTFPLAHGASARVVRLRAYGNAINAQAAQIFVECVIDAQRGIA
jgi:DNA (cytosine-5)-methyltransferase 1